MSISRTKSAARPALSVARVRPTPPWAGLDETLQQCSVRRVELKMLLDPAQDFSEIAERLGMASARTSAVGVHYVDDREHSLRRQGVNIRIREFGRMVELGVKLRGASPIELPSALCGLPGLTVELDALPGSAHWAWSIKNSLLRAHPATPSGDRWLDFSSPEQRLLLTSVTGRPTFARYNAVHGPMQVHRLIGSTRALPRLMLERWTMPDGRRLLELSTKCRPQHTEPTVMAMREMLWTRHLEPASRQRTKTEECLRGCVPVTLAG